MLTEMFQAYSTPVLRKRLIFSLIALYTVWAGAGFSIIAALIKGEQSLLLVSGFVLLISIFAYQQKQDIARVLTSREQ